MKNKYNLKKLIMENYLLSEKESKEFSEWVAKNLDYEITLSKDDFTTFLFNSNAETEIEFIEEILEKGSCCAGAMNDDIQYVMNLLAEITDFKSKEDLVEKIKELEIKINFLELQNESLLSRPEPTERIIAAEKTIDDLLEYFEDYDFGYSLNDIKKINTNVCNLEKTYTKKAMIKNGIKEEVIEAIMLDRTNMIADNYSLDEDDIDLVEIKKSITENKKMFNFLKNNKEFVRAVIKLKQSDLDFVPKKDIKEPCQKELEFANKNEDTFGILELDNLDSLFAYSLVPETGEVCYCKFTHSIRTIFGTRSLKKTAQRIGARYKLAKSSKSKGRSSILLLGTLDDFIEKYNNKVIEILEKKS